MNATQHGGTQMKATIERCKSGWVVNYTTRSGRTGETWCRTMDDAETRRTELYAMSASGLL
jgi:hypothetical protein